jgi:hypothetical protein
MQGLGSHNSFILLWPIRQEHSHLSVVSQCVLLTTLFNHAPAAAPGHLPTSCLAMVCSRTASFFRETARSPRRGAPCRWPGWPRPSGAGCAGFPWCRDRGARCSLPLRVDATKPSLQRFRASSEGLPSSLDCHSPMCLQCMERALQDAAPLLDDQRDDSSLTHWDQRVVGAAIHAPRCAAALLQKACAAVILAHRAYTAWPQR